MTPDEQWELERTLWRTSNDAAEVELTLLEQLGPLIEACDWKRVAEVTEMANAASIARSAALEQALLLAGRPTHIVEYV